MHGILARPQSQAPCMQALLTLAVSWCGLQGEGPAIFKPAPGAYYLMSSHLTYWAPNQAMMYHATAPSLAAATWRSIGAPVTGAGANVTFGSQPTAIFPLQLADGTTLHVYMGDRWNYDGPGSVRPGFFR